MLLLLAACTPDDPPADDTAIADDGCNHPMWEGAWPFPNNRLVNRGVDTPTGLSLAITAAMLPLSRNGVPPLESEWLADIDGFSRLAPAVVQLEHRVEPEDFGTESNVDAPMFLLDVASGQVIPGRLSVTTDGHTLTVWPDAALAPSTLHAIVLRSDLPDDTCFSAGPALLGAEAAGDALADELGQARAAAEGVLSPELVAAVIPFSTRSEQGESATMKNLASTLDIGSEALSIDETVDCALATHSWCGDGVAFVVEGAATLPKWQDDAGMFVESGGVATQQGTEDVQFWLMAPEAPGAPLIVLQHGLGGDRGGMASFGRQLVAAGYAVAAIDAVAHGDRPHDGDTTLLFFGIDFDRWNLPTARDNVRQTAADHLALRHALADATFDGFSIDAENAAYVGQSLGGIIGASTCATDTGLDRCVLNVPGGRLVEIVRANAAYAALMNIFFDPSDQDSEVELFSAMGQTIVDPADPALTAPRILADAPARPVLVQEATEDGTVANQTTEVMARSMGIPLLEPSLEPIRGITSQTMPVSVNVDGVDGAVTAGLTQFAAEHPFLTYDGGAEGERALRQLLTFLASDTIEASE